ncbi:hypothetical protein W97_02928 [Coniosporium apollinis CBS 100218]|uniref:Uncharacterized protein n=1 Tax=Coniosporium apollinis (strain CBS 100218) TaxID=1168221 RepID=R7YP45_CONA1|nr:uncharacterized protein W97_02928 [Coniosporium apollinis CBS 100218]EON63700.1 hypothetical protein W97_02928 [Coniosporium apollinis CBS 100218]
MPPQIHTPKAAACRVNKKRKSAFTGAGRVLSTGARVAAQPAKKPKTDDDDDDFIPNMKENTEDSEHDDASYKPDAPKASGDSGCKIRELVRAVAVARAHQSKEETKVAEAEDVESKEAHGEETNQRSDDEQKSQRVVWSGKALSALGAVVDDLASLEGPVRKAENMPKGSLRSGKKRGFWKYGEGDTLGGSGGD